MSRSRTIVSLLLASLTFGCDGTEVPKEAKLGEVRLALAQVPADVHCVVVVATGSITVKQAFSVTSSDNPTLTLHGLPVGSVTLDAAAYASACPVPASEVATWVAEPRMLTLVPGTTVPIVLVLRQATDANVTLDFNANSCQPGLTLCGAVCRNLSSDPANCGKCGVVCASGQSCTAGVCQKLCPPASQACGNECVFLAADPNNCGTCGNHCPTNARCTDGVCGEACNPPRTLHCGLTCVDPLTDDHNCLICGNSCVAFGLHCVGGNCVL